MAEDEELDPRTHARILACQAAYMADAQEGGASLADAGRQMQLMNSEPDRMGADAILLEFFADSHREHLAEADRMLEGVMRISLADTEPLERAMLRLAALELGWRKGTPAAVIIDEWIGVSRVLGSETSHKFVNAVLEQLRVSLKR